VLVLVVVLDCFPRRAERGRRRSRARLGKIRRLPFVLVLVVVLDCFPRRADRGRRRPRARLGKPPLLLYRARPRHRTRLLSSPGGPRTTTTTSTIRKNPAASLSCSCPSSCSIVFPAWRTEDDDDHEHDQEEFRCFFIVLDCFPRRADPGRRRPRARSGKTPPLLFRARPRRRTRLLSSPGGTRTTTITSTTRRNSAASLSCSSSSSCSTAFLAGQNEDDDDHEHDQEKSRRSFFVLVLVVVLDCFPRRAERGRRRPRARLGKTPPLYRARPRRRARLFSPPGGTRTTTITSTIRKSSATSLSCSIAFLAGRTQDDDDHEHD
jgi:hypothetical protein